MKRIQIIEDDTAIRTELEMLLQSNGYMTVEEGSCDLVLMDVNLPGENGFTLCRKLRQTSRTPVIFLTARDTPEDELLAFGVGGDDFIRICMYGIGNSLGKDTFHIGGRTKAFCRSISAWCG